MLHQRLKGISGISDWKCYGDVGLSSGPTGAILLSRQSRRPKPGDWWLSATLEAAKSLAKEGRTIICGGGILHLDFARWAAHRAGAVVWVDVPGGGTRKKDEATPEWCDLRIKSATKVKSGKKEIMTARDRWVVELADKVIAVSVRADGNMEKLAEWALDAGKEVLVAEPPRRNKSTHGNFNLLAAGAKPVQLPVTPRPLEQQILPFWRKSCVDPAGLTNYLWHFTRECAGPWPGQEWDEYFNNLVVGKPEAAHEAIDSLERILSEGVIRAHGGMVRGGYKVVCWSDRSPAEIALKPIYRSALGRWNFKPYAVGIRYEVAKRLGTRPVQYGDEDEYRNMPEEERFLFQPASTKTADWRREEEWRTLGDFPLDNIDPTDAAVLVRTSTEPARIERASRFPTIVIEEILAWENRK